MWNCDWSSDVCSSDLPEERVRDDEFLAQRQTLAQLLAAYREEAERCDQVIAAHDLEDRSEERRVGKEGRCGWVVYQQTNRRIAVWHGAKSRKNSTHGP